MQKMERFNNPWERQANNTEKNIPQRSLLEAFIENVKKTPNVPAIIYDGIKNLTYIEAAEYAAIIAKSLIAAGAKVGDKVAVSLPVGKEMVCAVLGVLWCGGTYVPVNCSQPIERRKSIYDQSQIKYCVTYSNSSAAQITDCKNILIDMLADDREELPEAYIASPDETAYIIFTSGSTGTPKGVEIAHGAAWNTIADILERFEFTNKDVAISISALDFDLSVFDIFGMLSIGGALAVLTDKTSREPAEWINVIRNAKVTIWNSVPALLEMLLVSLKSEEQLDNLRMVLISGDRIKPSLYSQIKTYNHNCRFIALGGATEASIWSNFYEVTELSEDWNIIPYGKPLSNQMFRVIYDNKDADDYVIGELWIGGLGLAKGYISATELTGKAFVYDNGKRWYKTGDLGYYGEDENIIFVGRKDNQVKINGFRIELGEIENHISKLEYVNNTAVLVQEDDLKKSLAGAIEIDNEKNISKIPDTKPVVFCKENAEDCIVADFIQKVLYDNGKPVFKREELSQESIGIISLWEKFLNNNTEIVPKDKNPITNMLDGKVNLFRSIISGEISLFTLLDDTFLAPSKLMLTPVIFEMVKEIVDKVREQIENAPDKKITVAMLFGKNGEVYLPFFEELSDLKDKVRFIYMESSTTMLKEANQKYKNFGFETVYIKTDYTYLLSEFAATADIVLAINGLHLFKDVFLGLAWIKLLLKKNGCLYATEARKLTALGIISAGVIEHGFTLYEKSRRNGPMLEPEIWAQKLVENNFEDIHYRQYKDENIYIFTAYNSKNNIPMNEEELKEYCFQKLVSYMIPEKFCYTTKFPLTNNGKVDRKAMLEWFKTEKANTGTLPQSETEKKIADIWCELFKADKVFIENNFFEIGGDSLLATRMLNSIRNCFGISITMKDIFDAATLREVAGIVDAKMDEFDLEEGEI